jgi:glycosidase
MYKKALALRHTNEALLEGSYAALNEDDANVMSYLPSYKGKAVLVALNRNLPLKLSM